MTGHRRMCRGALVLSLAVGCAGGSGVLLDAGTSGSAAAAAPGDGRAGAPAPAPVPAGWRLVSSESFGSLSAVARAKWVRDPGGDASPWHVDHLEDDGQFFDIQGGPDFRRHLAASPVLRKQVAIGNKGWLTAELAARDNNMDGAPDNPPVCGPSPWPDSRWQGSRSRATTGGSSSATRGLFPRSTAWSTPFAPSTSVGSATAPGAMATSSTATPRLAAGPAGPGSAPGRSADRPTAATPASATRRTRRLGSRGHHRLGGRARPRADAGSCVLLRHRA
jgi:hypothetical protein